MKMHGRQKSKPKTKLTDAERHARFVDTARKIGASEDPTDFEKAFKNVASRTQQSKISRS